MLPSISSLFSSSNAPAPQMSEEQRRVKQIVTAIYAGKDGKYTEYSLNYTVDKGTELLAYITKLPIDQNLWSTQKIEHIIPGKEEPVSYEGNLYDHIQFALTNKFAGKEISELDRVFFDKLENLLYTKGFAPTQEQYLAKLKINPEYSVLEKWCKANSTKPQLEEIVGKFEQLVTGMKFIISTDMTSSKNQDDAKLLEEKNKFIKSVSNLSNIVWVYHFETKSIKKDFPTIFTIDFDEIERRAFAQIIKTEEPYLASEQAKTTEAKKQAIAEVEKLTKMLQAAREQRDYLTDREIDEIVTERTKSLLERLKNAELAATHALEHCEAIIKDAKTKTDLEDEFLKLNASVSQYLQKIEDALYNKSRAEKEAIAQSTMDLEKHRKEMQEKQDTITKLEGEKNAEIALRDVKKNEAKALEEKIKAHEAQVEKYSRTYQVEINALEKDKSHLEKQWESKNSKKLLADFPKYNLYDIKEKTTQNANSLIKALSLSSRANNEPTLDMRGLTVDIIKLNPVYATTMLKSGVSLEFPHHVNKAVPLLVYLNQTNNAAPEHSATTLCLLNFYVGNIKKESPLTNILSREVMSQPHIKRFINKHEPEAVIDTRYKS